MSPMPLSIAWAMPATFGQAYDLVGPKVYTLRELVDYTATLVGSRAGSFALSEGLAYLQAGLMWLAPKPLMSPDNLRSMEVDSVCEAASCQLPANWKPTALEAVARPTSPATRRRASSTGSATARDVRSPGRRWRSTSSAARSAMNCSGGPIADRDYVVVGATPQAMLAAGLSPGRQGFPGLPPSRDARGVCAGPHERKTGRGYHGFAFHAAPDVTLDEDLARRDLTINAMAKAPDGTLVDPFHGQRDLEAGILRHVGPAFAEDPGAHPAPRPLRRPSSVIFRSPRKPSP
jgi:hypothetical protein